MMSNPVYIIDPEKWPESKDKQPAENKAEILAYLRSFEPVARATEWITDVITGEEVKLPEMATFVDGGWCWDSADIYYFEKYDAKLNPKFAKKFA